MAIVDFDGDNLLITVHTGITQILVDVDLYSAWKEWLLDDSVSNKRGYPQAFRVTGGDPLSAGIDAGGYFFLQNQFGWRIRGAEEDAEYQIIGNLVPEDATINLIRPTNGGYVSLFLGLQPITQSVDTILTQQQEISYDGRVFIDYLRGQAGIAYPTGTHSTPVNNTTNAIAISKSVGTGLYHFVISNGVFQLSENFPAYLFEGLGGFATININNFDVSGSIFTKLLLFDADFTNTTQEFTINKCDISGGTNLNGKITESNLKGTITLKEDGNISFNDCNSHQTALTLDTQNGDNIKLQMKNYNGAVNLQNFSGSSMASFDLNSGHLTLESTCVEGVIVVRGTGHLTNNITTTGVTVITTGFVEGTYVTEMYQHSGLDINDPLVLTENSETDVDMDTDDIKVKITKVGDVRTKQRQVTP